MKKVIDISQLSSSETLTITLSVSQKLVLYEIAKRTIMREEIAKTRNSRYKIDEEKKTRKKANPSAKDDLVTVLSLLNLSAEYRFDDGGKIVNDLYYPPSSQEFENGKKEK